MVITLVELTWSYGHSHSVLIKAAVHLRETLRDKKNELNRNSNEEFNKNSLKKRVKSQ